MNVSTVELPLMISATVLPPDTTCESVVTALVSAVMSILSVDENPEIGARSPMVPTVLTTEATLSVLLPPEKVSVPARVAAPVSKSTVPPLISVVLLTVADLLMLSEPPEYTVSLLTAVAPVLIMVKVPEIWSPVAVPPEETVSVPPDKIVVAESVPPDPMLSEPPL